MRKGRQTGRACVAMAALAVAMPAEAQPEVEPMSQMNREAILAIHLPGERPEFTLFYDTTRAAPTEVKAAPVNLCRSIDMRPADVQDLPPDDPVKTPDVRRLVVLCR